MATKTKVKKPEEDANRIIAEQSSLVPIDVVKPYPQNPRVGNLAAIQDSLKQNGQFRPIIVQKTTNYILGGNHTWRAAVAEGWDTIQVAYVDVDDERAKRIVLADNRTNDLATYNADILAEILDGLEQPDLGTGYDAEAVSDLLRGIEEKNNEAVGEVLRPPIIHPIFDQQQFPESDNYVGGLDTEVGDPAADIIEPDQFKAASDQLAGGFALKEDATYELGGVFDIPPLLTNMLVQPDDVPRDLVAWAGSATKDWPNDDQWWLYNFGIDSTSGMKDISKIILSFYCWDDYFEPWWIYPDRYVTKTLNSGITMAVMHDFSTWTSAPKAVCIYNIFRAYWLSRYMQEAGLKVIPNVADRYGEYKFFDEVVRPAMPKKVPVVAIQVQTLDDKDPLVDREVTKKYYAHMGQSIDADLTIFYASKNAQSQIADWNWPGEHLVVTNRLDALSKQAKGRKKKTTL